MVCAQLVSVILGLLVADHVRVRACVLVLLAQADGAQHASYLCQSQHSNLRMSVVHDYR